MSASFPNSLKKFARLIIEMSAAPLAAYLAAVISNRRFSCALKKSYQDIFYSVFRVIYFDPVRLLNREAAFESATFIKDRLAKAVFFRKEFLHQFWTFALSKAPRDGLFCEFGVHAGSSLNFFAEKRPEVTWHGFDSFEGLPEDWTGADLPKGTFALRGERLPVVRGNVELHKGWFDLTLPEFAARNAGQISFMHIDCDLYSSTKTVFDVLGERIKAGTVIVFDEFFNYPGWREHEYRAFMEFCAARRVKYSFIAFNFARAAVLIEEVSTSNF